MQSRPSQLALVVVFALGLVVGSLGIRPSAGQLPQPLPIAPRPQVGRYQVSVTAFALVITDTATARTWVNTEDPVGQEKKWVEVKLPAELAKK